MNNVAVIDELYRAFRAKDYGAFLAICTPDLEWIQNEGFPRGSTHRGAQAVVDGVFKAFDDAWSEWSWETEETLDAGATVVVIGAYSGRHKASGKAFRSPAAHVYDLVEGRVARFRQFADTKTIWDAMS